MEIVKYEFTLQAEETIHLPAYKGSAFHGGFGQALHAISPIWSRLFLNPKTEAGHTLPAPYVLLPPLDERTAYGPGEIFVLNLTLFGKANQHHALAQAAIEYLGSRLGLGYRNGKYSIQDIATRHPPEIAAFSPETSRIKLRLNTRLRLKQNNRLTRKAPDFTQLVTRLSGRFKTLKNAYGGEETDLTDEFTTGQAELIRHHDHTNWDDWDRFSGRQKSWMKFGGLLGEITYQGELQPFMPLLQLGEWIHIGGKTSFGLGKYRLIEEPME